MLKLRKIVSNAFDRLFRNNLNADLTDIENAINAQDIRINNIVANAGNSNTEVVDARQEPDGTEHEVLREHLFSIHDKIENLNKKTDGIINIKEYEHLKVAVNTDYDWLPAFNAAMTALDGKGKLKVPEGIYGITGTIVIPGASVIEVEGEGQETIIQALSTMDVMIKRDDGWKNGGSIRSLFLEANRKANTGIHVEQASQYFIEKVVIQNYLDIGILLKNTHGKTGAVIYGTKIQDCVITGLHDWFTGITEVDRPNYGILMKAEATDNWVKNCVIMNTKLSFIRVEGSNTNIIQNHLYSYPEQTYNPDYFIDVWSNTTNIKDNFFDGAKTGIRLGGLDCSVSDNTFFWNGRTEYNYDKSVSIGIFVDYNTTGAIITDNRFAAYTYAVGYDIKLADTNEKRNYIADNVSNSMITNKLNQIYEWDITNNKVLINAALRILQGDLTVEAGNIISNKNGGTISMKTPGGVIRTLTFDNNGGLQGIVLHAGTTAQRPTGVWENYVYRDTTINKVIIKTASGWVDMMGNVV